MEQRNKSRRQIALVSAIGTTQLHLRNPWIIAWWSAAFPGFGHLLLSKYLRGFLLFLWEVYINLQSNLNLGIYYSFVGDFKQAKAVINKEWMLLYIGTYIFAIWDSYRTTVDINNSYKLAAREDVEIDIFKLNPLEINYVDKRSPSTALIWSILMPGAGQLYIHRIVTAGFIIIWWVTITRYSGILPAIHYTFTGQLQEAKAALDIQWTLNIPSVLGFSFYDAYVNAVENNKLYDWQLSKFLKKEYQYGDFKMPTSKRSDGRNMMYIVATFGYNANLELAITEMQMKGIAKEKILASPLDKRQEERRLFDTLHYSDGLSLIDLAAMLGTIFMLFGSIYGFELKWGPIWWGLIGLGFGAGLGFIIKLYTTRKNAKYKLKEGQISEVVLIIECNKDEADMVKSTLWSNNALGVSAVELAHIN